MGNTTGKDTFDSRERAPLHRTPGAIDAGKSNDDNESSIIKPSSNEHAVMPGPGGEAPGQVSKM